MTTGLRTVRVAVLLLAAAGMAACGASRNVPGRLIESPSLDGSIGDPTSLYHAAGMASALAPVQFVGTAAHYAGAVPDSTLTLVAISLPARTLTFAREGDRYRAPYDVELRVLRGGQEIERVTAHESVRVGTFRETARTDEAIIFQRWLTLAPGPYTLRLSVRDVGGARASSDSLLLSVPRLGGTAGGISTPVAIYDARPRAQLDSIPAFLPRPRSTAVFGRDSLVTLYVESYGAAPAAEAVQSIPLAVTVRNDAAVVVASDTASLPRRGALYSGTLRIPVSRAGVGAATVAISHLGSADTVRAPIFLTFGEDLPIAPFDDMIEYLRYFASPSRLRRLRTTPPDRRAEAWAEFLRETDPAPHTAEHEALQAYFGRIQLANARFRDEAPLEGWLSDRGMVFVALGEPDSFYEQTVNPQTRRVAQGPVRVQVWEYHEYRTQFMFTDEQQARRFRLTPRSDSEFRAILQRLLIN